MKSLTGLGKYIFAIPFLLFGFGHMTNAGGMAGMVPSYIPGGSFWIYLTGLGMLGFAISVFIGKFDKLAALLCALMILVFILTIHISMVQSDKSGMAFVGLMKDIALIGGALMYADRFARDNSVVG